MRREQEEIGGKVRSHQAVVNISDGRYVVNLALGQPVALRRAQSGGPAKLCPTSMAAGEILVDLFPH